MSRFVCCMIGLLIGFAAIWVEWPARIGPLSSREDRTMASLPTPFGAVLLMLCHITVEVKRFGQPLDRFRCVGPDLEDDVRHTELRIALNRNCNLLHCAGQGCVK